MKQKKKVLEIYTKKNLVLALMLVLIAALSSGCASNDAIGLSQQTPQGSFKTSKSSPDSVPAFAQTPAKTPVQTKAPTKDASLPLKGKVIGLDPGHQKGGNSAKEPVAPGSKTMKMKVSAGTQGRWTKVPEYQVNLDVALLLKDMLEKKGATVVMTRTTNNVDMSNIERAQFMNRHKTDYALRLHCNGSDDSDVHGAFVLVPDANPYLKDCNTAANLLIDAFCRSTGAKNLGIMVRGDQTGFNWCKRMIVNIEMGHMTNRAEDARLSDKSYQKKMAQGLCNGILEYFKRQ